MTGITETIKHKIGVPFFNFEGLGDNVEYSKRVPYGDVSIQTKTTISVGERVRLETEIDLRQLPSLFFQKDTPQNCEAEKAKQEFNALVKTWFEETAHLSLVRQQIIHPSFLRIIGMGEDALPFVFREFEKIPMLAWLVALEAIVGEDMASDAKTHKDAVKIWLDWGKENAFR